MIKYFITILFFCFMLPSLDGQKDSLLLTKNFDFEDGVYLTYESFKKNEPTYSWNEVKTNLVTNPQTFMAQIEFLTLKEGAVDLNLQEIWGVSLGGMPYVRLERGAVKKELTNFSALRVRGKICYFEYKDVEEVEIPMPVYNPYTGKPFRKSSIFREIDVYYSKILDFETGMITDLTPENLKAWVEDDAQLINALESLGEDADEKLFKCILIYDDRHKVYIK